MGVRSDNFMPLFPLGVVLLPHMPMALHIFDTKIEILRVQEEIRKMTGGNGKMLKV
jgi:Lon protease-like protein